MIVTAGDAQWSAWKTVVPIRAAVPARGLVRVRLPAVVAPDADGRFPDLRLIDERGNETPFALDPARAATNAREAAIAAATFKAGRGSVALVDLGRRAPLVDRLVLAVDAERDPTYFERVAVDASADRRRWRTVQSGTIVYRVADDDGKGSQDVAVAPTRGRWLRLRVLDAHAPFPLTGVTVERLGAMPPALVPLPIVPAVTLDATTHRQVWTFAAAQPFRPSAISFAQASGTFERAVRIEESADGRAWSFAGDGTIARYSDGSEQTAFAFPEDTAAGWRVVAENGDNPPLDARPEILGVPHVVVFFAAPERRYRLLTANPAAAPASYDLGARLAHARWTAAEATTAAPEANAAYRDPRALGRRVALVAAALLALLAGFALAQRAMRDTPSRGAAV